MGAPQCTHRVSPSDGRYLKLLGALARCVAVATAGTFACQSEEFESRSRIIAIASERLSPVKNSAFLVSVIEFVAPTKMDDVATIDRGASFGDIVTFRANDGSRTDLSVERTVEDDECEIAAESAVIADRDNARDDEKVESSSNNVFRTTAEMLHRVQRELCLIRLCWPEATALTTGDFYARSLPDTYRRVSDKERLLLWYAENFRRQFHARHVYRKPLLLACENECGVQVSPKAAYYIPRINAIARVRP